MPHPAHHILYAPLLAACLALPCAAQPPAVARERLARAIDYFQGGKYHEALVLLQPLDSAYTLSPRLRAQMGVCLWHEEQWEAACRVIGDALPHLDAFAPEERAVYVYAEAESHFCLARYAEAAAAYDTYLTLCHSNERAEAHYRLGLCCAQTGEWTRAARHLAQADTCYRTLTPQKATPARLRQIAAMRAECERRAR